MKKLLGFIRNKHSIIYRISLFVLAIILCVYLMPRKKSFKYEPIEGRPWPHENFISDMEFSILKPVDKVATEKQQVIEQKGFFFRVKKEKQEEVGRCKLGCASDGLLGFTSEPIPDYIMRALQPKVSVHPKYGKLRY